MPDPGEPGQPAPRSNGTSRAEILMAMGATLRRAVEGDRGRRYTLHLDFTADDATRARETAMALAEGLGILREDVDTHSALMSVDHRWGQVQPVFCLASGPDGTACADITGHPGWHAEPGINGLRWGDGDAAPGKAEGTRR